jgi:hypothetical protein
MKAGKAEAGEVSKTDRVEAAGHGSREEASGKNGSTMCVALTGESGVDPGRLESNQSKEGGEGGGDKSG